MEPLTSMPSIQILLGLYAKEGKKYLRLGQYFVGKYIKYSWPELFYEEDYEKALNAIAVYLHQLQYIEDLPTPVENRSYGDSSKRN